MWKWIAAFVLLASSFPTTAIIVDRIAIIVGDHIIKDSDIERDLRITEFLNQQPLLLNDAARKEAADRLINQILIRHEIRTGEYPFASLEQAQQELNALITRRYKTHLAFELALHRYGITEQELEVYFQWELTVLDFINARFKPAVYITGQQIRKYYSEHAAALEREYPGQSFDQLRDRIRDILTGEQVNEEFFTWLNQQRSGTKILYLEEKLQ
jgi:hypothetical protein